MNEKFIILSSTAFINDNNETNGQLCPRLFRFFFESFNKQLKFFFFCQNNIYDNTILGNFPCMRVIKSGYILINWIKILELYKILYITI